jgi:pyruvate dehydrogenase E1 component
MYGGTHANPNVMYYLTVYNEPFKQPAEPENVDVDGIVRGIHRVSEGSDDGHRVQLLASGVGVPWAYEAQELLVNDWGVAADIWSVTSWNELRREALEVEKHNFLNPEDQKVPYVTSKLDGAGGPFVATSDYDHLVQDQIRPWIPGDYHTLGADGFGYSDTRRAARRQFLIDAHSLVVKALQALVKQGSMDASVVREAIEKYDLTNPKAGESGAAGGDA